jgi:hypothetical protein
MNGFDAWSLETRRFNLKSMQTPCILISLYLCMALSVCIASIAMYDGSFDFVSNSITLTA